jgi:hypothetical protein
LTAADQSGKDLAGAFSSSLNGPEEKTYRIDTAPQQELNIAMKECLVLRAQKPQPMLAFLLSRTMALRVLNAYGTKGPPQLSEPILRLLGNSKQARYWKANN